MTLHIVAPIFKFSIADQNGTWKQNHAKLKQTQSTNILGKHKYMIHVYLHAYCVTICIHVHFSARARVLTHACCRIMHMYAWASVYKACYHVLLK